MERARRTDKMKVDRCDQMAGVNCALTKRRLLRPPEWNATRKHLEPECRVDRVVEASRNFA